MDPQPLSQEEGLTANGTIGCYPLTTTRKCREPPTHKTTFWKKSNWEPHLTPFVSIRWMWVPTSINSNNSSKDGESGEKRNITFEIWLHQTFPAIFCHAWIRCWGIQDKPQTEECICKIHCSLNTRSINSRARDVVNNPEQKWPVMSEEMLCFQANQLRQIKT